MIDEPCPKSWGSVSGLLVGLMPMGGGVINLQHQLPLPDERQAASRSTMQEASAW